MNHVSLKALPAVAAAMLIAAPTAGASIIIQADDFEGQTVGATLDATSGDDIAGWSKIAGSTNAEEDVTIVSGTPGFSPGNQMQFDLDDVGATGGDFIFAGMDNSIAASDIKTLSFTTQAQLFEDGRSGVLNLSIGVDNTKRYALVLDADDENNPTESPEIRLFSNNPDSVNDGDILSIAPPVDLNEIHNYEFLFTPGVGTARLQALVDGMLLFDETIDGTSFDPIDFSGDNLIAIFGVGGGKQAVVDNVQFANVPEPTSFVVWSVLGLMCGVYGVARRRRRSERR